MQTVKNFSPSYGDKFPDIGAPVLSRSGVALYVLTSLFMFIWIDTFTGEVQSMKLKRRKNLNLVICKVKVGDVCT